MRLISRWVLRVMLAVLGLGLILIAWLGFTSAGLGFALARVPGLSFDGEVQGRLLGAIELKQLSYTSTDINISADMLKFDWQPAALFKRDFKVLNVAIEGLNGDTQSVVQETDEASSSLNLPVNVELDQLQVDGFTWAHDQAKVAELDSLSLSAELVGARLSVKKLELTRAQESLSASGTLDISFSADGQLEIEFSHRLTSSIGFAEPFVGGGTVKGQWQSFELEHSAEAPYQTQSTVTVENAVSGDPGWNLSADLNDFLVAGEQGDEASVSGKITSFGSVESNTVQTNLNLLANGEVYTFDLDTTIEKNQLRLNQLTVGASESKPSLSAMGLVDDYQNLFSDDANKANFSLNGEWQSLDFLSTLLDVSIPSTTGKLQLDGGLDEYAFKVQSFIQSDQFKQLKVTLNGSGSQSALSTEAMSLVGNGIALNSAATLSFDNQKTDVALDNITGSLRDQSILGEAALSFVGTDIQVDKLKLNIGDASLKGQGLLGDESNFEWSVRSTDLSLFTSDLSGSFIGSGTLNGQLNRPVVSADVSINNLVYRKWSIESANGDLKLGLASRSPWSGELKMNHLRFAKRDWLNSASLTLTGSLEQHQVAVKGWFTENDETDLIWKGQYLNDALAFSGRITNLPANASDQFTIDSPFSLVGNANVEFNGRYDFKDSLIFDSSVRSDKLSFKSRLDNESDVILSDLNIGFSANDSVDFRLIALLGDDGKLNGQANIAGPLLSENFSESQLDGMLRVDYPNLNSLQALLPPSITVDGGFTAVAQVKGTANAPELVLDASIKDGLLKMPEQGIELKQATIDITSVSANRFKVVSSALAGQGTLDIDGNVDISNHKLPSSEIRLIANNALFINTPEISAEGGADLRLYLIDNTLDISGTVVAKKADIKVGRTMSAVQESPDLVLQGLNPKEGVLGLTMQLDIDLGDNTQISASGLTGRLVGKPSVKLDKKGLLTSVGEVQVVGGAFSILGESLKIDKGVASYAGGAIDNPRLSFEATKKIGSIRAGISIEGNADSPELALFSQPTFEDQDILALVFFEKQLEQLSSVDALKLVSIANALRGGNTDSKIDGITDTVANYLGVDNFDVSFDAENDQRKLSLNSKINSKLNIGYAYNFISSLQALFLRYKINDHWSIQSSVDVESGADVRYRIEKD